MPGADNLEPIVSLTAAPTGGESGEPCGTRTHDPLIKSPVWLISTRYHRDVSARENETGSTFVHRDGFGWIAVVWNQHGTTREGIVGRQVKGSNLGPAD